jgi:hypothetical protein
MTRDYMSYRTPSRYSPPWGSVSHKLVTCDRCGREVGLWLPDKLPTQYESEALCCVCELKAGGSGSLAVPPVPLI